METGGAPRSPLRDFLRLTPAPCRGGGPVEWSMPRGCRVCGQDKGSDAPGVSRGRHGPGQLRREVWSEGS